MGSIDTIPIETENRGQPNFTGATPCGTPTGNLLPILHEIRHALARWLETGENHIIDLGSIPMAPGEESGLLDTLGRGEVQAELDALGRSEVYETAIAGVWLVTHRNTDDALIGRFIEICKVPDILQSQAEDARQALIALDELLANTEADT